MRLLWIATKSPWPPVDGGRRLLLAELEALAAAGVNLTLVAPCPGLDSVRAEARRGLSPLGRPVLLPVRPRPWPLALLVAAARGWPASVARHTHDLVGREAARALAGEAPDAVVAQPLQAWENALAAVSGSRVPLLLRAENVESELWSARAAGAAGEAGGSGARRALLAREARRMARYEGAAVRRSAATLALSPEDAAGLAAAASPDGAGATRVRLLRPAFPGALPAGAPLPGAPAVVLFGHAGWGPNREAESGFVAEVWPHVRARLPGAVLHYFGAAGGAVASDGIAAHPAPRDSAEALAAGSVLVLPLRSGSGVRIRLLEAWARGVPVVASAAAVRGLGGRDGGEWLRADDADGFVAALARLAAEPELAARLVAAGRARLAAEHAPAAFATALTALVSTLGEAPGWRGPRG